MASFGDGFLFVLCQGKPVVRIREQCDTISRDSSKTVDARFIGFRVAPPGTAVSYSRLRTAATQHLLTQ